jgi:hypothetical protein
MKSTSGAPSPDKGIVIFARQKAPNPNMRPPQPYSSKPWTRPIFTGKVGKKPLYIDFLGKLVKVGTVDETMMPRCIVDHKPIPLDVLIAASSRGRPALYCCHACRFIQGARDRQAEKSDNPDKARRQPKTSRTKS